MRLPTRVPRRLDVPSAVVVGLLAFVIGWFVIGLGHVWSHPIIGWLPLPVIVASFVRECYRLDRCTDLDRDTRKFWGRLGVAAAVLMAGVLSSMHDALGGPVPSPAFSPRTQALYGVVAAIILWALLRLPAWQRSRSDWLRFGLDTAIVLLTGGVLAWHCWLNRAGFGDGPTATPAATLVILVVATISLVAFLKVAFAGAGRLDRGALYLLAAGVALAAATAGIAPLLTDRPYLSTTVLAAPFSQVTGVLAARRQWRRRHLATAERPRARRFSILPYVAVATFYGALLAVELPEGGPDVAIALTATALTVLVVIRQISTLRDNARLLDTVDASLRQLRAYQKELDHQVTHDPLTGITNRPAYAGRLAAQLATGEPAVVVLLDLDDFKVVNDRHGHETGDALLRAISTRLRQSLRPRDTVARLGGDEFTLLLPGAGMDEAEDLLSGLLATVQQPLMLDGREMAPRISAGVTLSVPGDSSEELLRRADVAMYAAKNAGGGRWTWFDPIMDARADTDARLGADLRQAIARDELFLLYQPIVELPTGRLAGLEALIRWRHPEHGLVSPADFIPLAERNGQIIEVGRWVLTQAMRQIAEWQREHGAAAPAKVSVNVSARQLNEPGFPEEVAALLAATGLDPARLVIEVTETAVLGTGAALEAVRRLDELGLRIALDDFGTGQSSLSLLVDTPVSWLKVDKSFVDGVTSASPHAVIVDGLIGITRGLRIQAVAEGVETAEQAERLHQAGYRFAQGYHFARPLSESDVLLLLARPSSRETRQSQLI
ncbi:bifunctional diguanylate cyclase/phosphodiesterase [Actinoplanes oblitus]|uniref:Bifunctional diguanylate cyclase/phosphodiesterase n=1 Tax=Actinoplanes oblitus TaxID=3040509 RepID=A0ABY8WCI2_9ACTN|nr:bifunctional diguanylate cyclase/phosphodiesterase [Actinoplanes oblitus]WIM94625.1 bifunctional diguanylate cyclase/phosphodiesterase [Actinoplanes oblitus]